MKCPKCGADIVDGNNFCEDCGASLKKVIHTDNSNLDFKDAIESDKVIIDSKLAVASNIGRKHPFNEDSGGVIRCINGNELLIVADGVTSALNSVKGSLKAVEVVGNTLSQNHNIDISILREAINDANKTIVNLPTEERDGYEVGPETTIVVASVMNSKIVLGWVGDSRAYIIGKTYQKQLTIDDSWVEHVVASGEMTRSKAVKDKYAHCVTQVLGMHDQEMEVHLLESEIEEGELLLLCSDGLWNYLQGENDILRAISEFGMEKDAIEICEHLISIANSKGGHDNITVAILKRF